MPSLDSGIDQPLFEQLVEQVALAVVRGNLRAGGSLPSVRGLASRLRINPNTAARALRDMETAGLARTLRGTGSVVAEGAPEAARSIAGAALEREVGRVVTVARRLGLELADVRALLGKRWEATDDADRS